jgi:hypothetical protein
MTIQSWIVAEERARGGSIMAMEDILKALMQSASAQQQPRPQSGGGSDAMSDMIGGLLGGSQQSGGGGDALSQVLGGLLGGSQQGSGAPASQVLGGLEQIIGGQAGAAAAPPNSNDPLMVLIQPLVNKVAAKVGISPAIATIIVSIVFKYLLKSHPSTPDESPLNLGNVMQTLASGGRLSDSTLQTSGMVNEVVRVTGMDERQAVASLNTTFGVIGSQLAPVKKVSGAKGVKSARGVRSKATLKRRR